MASVSCPASGGFRFRQASEGFRCDAIRAKSSSHASTSLSARPPLERRSVRLPRQARGSHLNLNRHRSTSVIVRAGPNGAQSDLYVLLVVDPKATKKEIKSAYKKAALKYHPDVNKAPDATERFNEVKNAYQTLSDEDQRRRYDMLRNGGGGGSGTWDPFKSAAGSSTRSRTSTGRASNTSPNKPEEPFYGFGDFFADLEKELDAFEKLRPNSGQPRTLWEELEALGEEFVDFLEEAAPEVVGTSRDIFRNETKTSSSSYKKSASRKDGTASSSSSSYSKTTSSSSTSSTSSTSSASTNKSQSSSPGSSAKKTASPPKRESVDEMLEKLKRDMGKK